MLIFSKSQRSMRLSTLAVAMLSVLLGFAPSAQGTTRSLPDGRLYEMVSPPAKGGGDILADSQRTRAAAAGDAVMFSSLTAFGDALGTGVASEYMAERSSSSDPQSNGWTTHAITPAQTAQSFTGASVFSEAAYQGEVSPDLSKGLVRTFSPLTDAPNVATLQNLYLRKDLRSSGAGSYQLLNDCLTPPDGPCSSPLPAPFPPFVSLLPGFRPWVAGASADFSHVIFETAMQLTNDSPLGFQTKLYEFSDGTVHLVGILPDSVCGSSPCLPGSSIAGQGAAPQVRYTPHTISADGRRIFFTADPAGCNGSDWICGSLYMRTDNGTPSATSDLLNTSERTDCADHDPCSGTSEPDSSQPAAYWDASIDGSRVFFTSQEALTDNAPLGADNKLYMYDTTQAGSSPHNLVYLNVDNNPGDASNDASGVVGASTDGRYVYFVSTGQLVPGPGKPLLNTGRGMYLWHDGQVSFIGQFGFGDLRDDVSNQSSVLTFVKQARVSPDGRTLLFSSSDGTGLLSPPYDHGNSCSNGLAAGCRELYVYSADTDTLRCASCNPSGATATADATTVVRTRTGGASTSTHLNHALSDHGKFVFFTSGEALVAADSNGKTDAYEYDTASGQVSLLSSGKDPSDSYFLDASAKGDDAFILTREQLAGWDHDQNYDVYDVREPHAGHAAGFPDPPATATECVGDPCHGTPADGQPSLSASSALTFGSGNVKAAHQKAKVRKLPKCKHGFVRKRIRGRVRCVRKKPRVVVRHAAHHSTARTPHVVPAYAPKAHR